MGVKSTRRERERGGAEGGGGGYIGYLICIRFSPNLPKTNASPASDRMANIHTTLQRFLIAPRALIPSLSL